MSERISPPLAGQDPVSPWLRRIGGTLLLLVVLFGGIGPLLTIDPQAQNLGAVLLPPGSAEAWLGTDHLGRSLLARLASATRLSVLLGLAAVVTAAIPGVMLGLAAAWAGGWQDRLLTAISDAFLALPGLLLVLIVTAFAPGDFGPLYGGLALALWVEYFRTTRAAARRRLAMPDVEAARLLGFGWGYILRYHILPDLIGPLMTLLAFGLATVVLAVSTLSFVGIGLRPPLAEWGSMMTELLPYYEEAPIQLLLPAGMLFLTVLALLLLTGKKAAS